MRPVGCHGIGGSNGTQGHCTFIGAFVTHHAHTLYGQKNDARLPDLMVERCLVAAGILLNPHHPLFRKFPTEYHSNLQWWELLNRAPVMQFTDFGKDFQPLVQSIDTWFISRKIGVLFEANVLNGKLIMTTLDLDSAPEKRIVARQLKKSILDYMNSENFHPEQKVEIQQVQELFTKVAGSPMLYTKDSPDELKPKIK